MRTLAGLVLCAVAVSAADSPGFTIGALRRDGVVIPFAAYDGKNWTARWPAPVRDPEIPTQMRAVDDCGDGLHPSDSGYCKMGDAIDLSLLD